MSRKEEAPRGKRIEGPDGSRPTCAQSYHTRIKNRAVLHERGEELRSVGRQTGPGIAGLAEPIPPCQVGDAAAARAAF